jgi:hypothetical protein
MYQKLLDLLYPKGFDPYKPWDGLTKFPTEDSYKHTHLSNSVIDEVLSHTSSNFWMEIGSMYGGSAIKAAQRGIEKGRDLTIFCVDPFCGDTDMWLWNKVNSENFMNGTLPSTDIHLDTIGIRPSIMEKFLGNIIESGLQKYILPLPSTGIVGMRVIEILLEQKKIEEGPGIMYIDSSHEWDETYTELKNAWRILAPGGIMMGDDFNWKSVRYEVERFAKDFGAIVEERENFQWIIKKPKEIGYIPSPFWTIN